MIQRYVSNELTHFVAAALKDDPARQYETLREILTSGVLRAAYRLAPEKVYSLPPDNPGYIMVISPADSLIDDSMFRLSVVCFCDIPLADLRIHMTKYGRFGVAFSKREMIAKRVSPVMYVPRSGLHDDTGISRVARLDEIARALYEAQTVLNQPRAKNDPWNTLASRWYSALTDLYKLVFCHVKVFDDSMAESDPANVYMEREWRAWDNIRFDLAEVYRIILPRSFAARLRSEFPTYHGEITFAESIEGDSTSKPT